MNNDKMNTGRFPFMQSIEILQKSMLLHQPRPIAKDSEQQSQAKYLCLSIAA